MVDAVTELYNEIKGKSQDAKSSDSVQSLYDEIKGNAINGEVQITKSNKSTLENIGGGIKQGVGDVVNTVGQGIGFIDRNVSGTSGEARDKAFNERVTQENKDFASQYGDSTGASIGRVGGQMLATAPLIPARAIQGIRAVSGALPTILSTGEKIAAPVLNRLGASVGTGALSGGVYGAATNASNENSLPVNIGENTLGGAIGGPILDRAGALASKVAPAVKGWVSNRAIDALVEKNGITPKAAKQILTELENEGMTLAEAEAQIFKLGKDGTIADLSPALQKFAGALAKRSGRASSIVENRYAARAEGADDSAHKIMEMKLGPKPNLDIEKKNIIDEAHKLVKSDYDLAHSSAQKLNVSGVVSHIDSALNDAVGSEADVLNKVKGYLFKTGKNAEGEPISILKNDVKGLHKARQALDDLLERLPQEGTSQKSHTYRAASTVRDMIDAELKTNPQMAEADAKFAEKMQVMKGLGIGSTSLNKGNYEQFEKTWNEAAPDVKETIRKGMRAQVGDLMEAAGRGELAGAQQLLGKKSANRKKLELAFGTNGTEVLDALASEAAKRGTEKFVASGSLTNLNERINNIFDAGQKSTSTVGDAVKGFALDAVTSGTPGAGTLILGAKHIGGDIANKLSQKRHDAFAEGVADLISRSDAHLKGTFATLQHIKQLQDKFNVGRPSELKLPIVGSSVVGTPIGKSAIEKAKQYLGN